MPVWGNPRKQDPVCEGRERGSKTKGEVGEESWRSGAKQQRPSEKHSARWLHVERAEAEAEEEKEEAEEGEQRAAAEQGGAETTAAPGEETTEEGGEASKAETGVALQPKAGQAAHLVHSCPLLCTTLGSFFKGASEAVVSTEHPVFQVRAVQSEACGRLQLATMQPLLPETA